MEIREVNRDDVQAFMEREWAVVDLEEHGFHDPDAWKKRWHFLAALENADVVGTAAFVVEGRVGYLDDLIVGAGHRGRGIGSQLLAGFEGICRNEGCHKVRLMTDADSRAEKFYKQNGYSREALLVRDCLQQDMAIMAKFLEAK